VTVESCTGGYVAKLLTDIAGSSAWFDGGWVTYSNDAKQRDVGVLAATLDAHGAVSEAVVREMASGGLARAGADRAVAISGVAGPGGGTARNPVGSVWFAVAVKTAGGIAIDARHAQLEGDRDAIRRGAAAIALEMLRLGAVADASSARR
jgi:nicotinamide-nucleotide amidase